MGNISRYVPHTDADCGAMLEAIGAENVEDLFEAIPKEYRMTRRLDLPEPLPEPDLLCALQGLQSAAVPGKGWLSFLGAGAYHHFVPSVVSHLSSRSEFYTAYTPYQPEISQGTLQAIFEYQSLICQLTGMEVSNASMYDGASSLAEAVLMSQRITRRKKILLSQAVHPEYRRVIETYINPGREEMVTIPYDRREGRTDQEMLGRFLDEEVSAVVVQSPNFFGSIEDLRAIGAVVHQAGGLLIAGFSEPLAFGLLTSPGDQGADIVAGEGQSLGIPVSYGGPYLGIFASLERFVRNMPGRLVGETVDLEGRRGFVLTLATREQHIRRERATSNICTNEGLCALMATIYLSTFGKEGLRDLALMNLSKSEYAKNLVSQVSGCSVSFSCPTFNEFVVDIGRNPGDILKSLQGEKILGGLPLERFYPELNHHLLVTVTEVVKKEEIDRWADAMGKALR